MVLNFGIIGTNWITHSYVSCAHATQKWSLTAVYSRKEDSAKEFAAKYPDRSVTLYTDLASFFADPNLYAVYIASPNILHYTQAKQALEAGKHVILEKPSCSTSAELSALFALSKEKGLFLIEAWRHIQEANFKILKSSLPKIGKVLAASITFCQFSSRYDALLNGELPNIFNLEMGGGTLADLGCYTIAAAVALFGEPKDATYNPVIVSSGADGGGTLMLQYEGFAVHLHTSKMYNSDAPSEIYGEKGTLRVGSCTDIESVVLWDPRAKTREELGVAKESLNLKEEAEEQARIINGKDWKAAGELEAHSRAVVKVTEKVRRDNGLLFPGEN